MKYLFIILTICLFSCNESSSHVKETQITLYGETGQWSTLICDSATMVSKNEAVYWVNGFRGNVIATNYLTISRY